MITEVCETTIVYCCRPRQGMIRMQMTGESSPKMQIPEMRGAQMVEGDAIKS